MGKHSRSGGSATTARPLIPCQRQRLIDIMNAVVVDRPSPKSKKRPVAAGLLLCLVHIPSPPLDNIRGFPQPHLVEVVNVATIGEAQR